MQIKVSSLADIEIKMVHTEDSLMYPESTDITYGTGAVKVIEWMKSY